jgi:hypothetical protein
MSTDEVKSALVSAANPDNILKFTAAELKTMQDDDEFVRGTELYANVDVDKLGEDEEFKQEVLRQREIDQYRLPLERQIEVLRQARMNQREMLRMAGGDRARLRVIREIQLPNAIAKLNEKILRIPELIERKKVQDIENQHLGELNKIEVKLDAKLKEYAKLRQRLRAAKTKPTQKNIQTLMKKLAPEIKLLRSQLRKIEMILEMDVRLIDATGMTGMEGMKEFARQLAEDTKMMQTDTYGNLTYKDLMSATLGRGKRKKNESVRLRGFVTGKKLLGTERMSKKERAEYRKLARKSNLTGLSFKESKRLMELDKKQADDDRRLLGWSLTPEYMGSDYDMEYEAGDKVLMRDSRGYPYRMRLRIEDGKRVWREEDRGAGVRFYDKDQLWETTGDGMERRVFTAGIPDQLSKEKLAWFKKRGIDFKGVSDAEYRRMKRVEPEDIVKRELSALRKRRSDYLKKDKSDPRVGGLDKQLKSLNEDLRLLRERKVAPTSTRPDKDVYGKDIQDDPLAALREMRDKLKSRPSRRISPSTYYDNVKRYRLDNFKPDQIDMKLIEDALVQRMDSRDAVLVNIPLLVQRIGNPSDPLYAYNNFQDDPEVFENLMREVEMMVNPFERKEDASIRRRVAKENEMFGDYVYNREIGHVSVMPDGQTYVLKSIKDGNEIYEAGEKLDVPSWSALPKRKPKRKRSASPGRGEKEARRK